MTNVIEIGKLLRANITGFIAGCQVTNIEAVEFGALVKVPISAAPGLYVYGLIYDIHIDDDGLVQQLAISDAIASTIIADNRNNRNVPLEISIVSVGHQKGGQIRHTLPPRPPLSLDILEKCTPHELFEFTNATPRFGYLRHILRSNNFPIGELLAAHIEQATRANLRHNPNWKDQATRELITLLRDDYPTLMAVLGALSDITNQGETA